MTTERPREPDSWVPAGVSVHVLVPAAGRSERFDGATAKQFVAAAGRPLLVWTLERILATGVTSVVVALPREDLERVGRDLSTDPRVRFVAGGASRQASVASALAACDAAGGDLVAVHDGARAAIDPEDFSRTVRAAARTGGAVLGRAATDTVKRVESAAIVETVDRSSIFLAETPQVFRRELLERALELARRDRFVGTDEASLVERLGEIEIGAVEAARPNPKLTFASDLALFERLFEEEKGT